MLIKHANGFERMERFYLEQASLFYSNLALYIQKQWKKEIQLLLMVLRERRRW